MCYIFHSCSLIGASPGQVGGPPCADNITNPRDCVNAKATTLTEGHASLPTHKKAIMVCLFTLANGIDPIHAKPSFGAMDASRDGKMAKPSLGAMDASRDGKMAKPSFGAMDAGRDRKM